MRTRGNVSVRRTSFDWRVDVVGRSFRPPTPPGGPFIAALLVYFPVGLTYDLESTTAYVEVWY